MVSSNLGDWQKITFEDAFTDITAKATKVDQSEFLHSGKFPIVDQGQNFIAGYTDDEELVWGDDLPVVIFGDHTRILKYVNFPFVLGADGTKVLKPNKDILPLFAYYQLLSFDIPSAGYSRHFKFLKDYKFQYPSLTEQKRIASLLARADRLRSLRRTARELGESLLQSVFLEMFGEEQKQNYVTIQELMDSEVVVDMQDGNHGGDYPRTSEFVSEGIPFLTATNVIGNRVFLDSAPRLKPERAHKLRIGWVKPNDVLLSHNATVGRVAIMPIFDGEVVLGTSLTYYRLNPEVLLPRYFSGILQSRHFQSQLESFMGQTTRNQVPITRQRELFVPVPPPLNLQEEFASVVRRVEQMRARQAEGERQVEGLFEALLGESFG